MNQLGIRSATLWAASLMQGGHPFETSRTVPYRGSPQQFREDLQHAVGLLPWPPGAVRRGIRVSFYLGVHVLHGLGGDPRAASSLAVDAALAQLHHVTGLCPAPDPNAQS